MVKVFVFITGKEPNVLIVMVVRYVGIKKREYIVRNVGVLRYVNQNGVK